MTSKSKKSKKIYVPQFAPYKTITFNLNEIKNKMGSEELKEDGVGNMVIFLD